MFRVLHGQVETQGQPLRSEIKVPVCRPCMTRGRQYRRHRQGKVTTDTAPSLTHLIPISWMLSWCYGNAIEVTGSPWDAVDGEGEFLASTELRCIEIDPRGAAEIARCLELVAVSCVAGDFQGY